MKKSPNIIKDRKIKIAVVGCGRISTNHFGAIETHHNDLQLMAVCDTNLQVLADAEKKYRVAAYSDLNELLKHVDVDVISLCTPSGSHPDQTIAVARAGKHIITEKPMATRWKEGVEMVEVCDEIGVRLFVVKQNRRNATLQLLKQAIDKGRFGKIYMANLNVYWTRPQSYYDQSPWRGTWEFDGGALMNQASHYIDLIHWLIGPVDCVQTLSGTLARDIEVEDTAVMNIQWRNGALGSVSVTMLTYPKNLEGSIIVLGEKGTAKIGGVAVNEIQEWSFDTPMPEDEGIKTASYETTSVYGFGHPLYYKNVVDVFRGIAEPETDGRQGLHSLELLIAAYRSARDRKTVYLPLDF